MVNLPDTDNMSAERWARLRDRVFVALSLVALLGFGATTYYSIDTNRTVVDINRRQIEGLTQDADASRCERYEIIVAVRSLGLAFSSALGLPSERFEEITPPNVEGLDCDALTGN